MTAKNVVTALLRRRIAWAWLLALVALAVSAGGCRPTPATLSPPGMVLIPAGEFKMGSDVGLTDEQPAHLVYLDAFWLDQTEVTNAMYSRCVQAGACRAPTSSAHFIDPALADHPVIAVSWNDAQAYCAWSGRRLPTEAEWEKAARWDPANRAPRIYPWGNDFDCARGNFDGSACDGFEGTAPVGSFPLGASASGALDMAGNVWEWVNDAFLETDPFGARANYYAISPYANPQGVDPALSAYRVLRGGGWKLNFGGGRAAYRLWFGLDDAYDFAGFRCARSG